MKSAPAAIPVFVCLVASITAANADGSVGKAIPLLPNLNWGMDKDAAQSKGLVDYPDHQTGKNVTGLPFTTITDITFAVQAEFSKQQDAGDVRSGLNYVVLQHEGQVAKTPYERLVRHITKGFLYAGQSSSLNDTTSFYNAADKHASLIVRTTTNHGKTYLLVAIAPGISK